MRHNIEKAAASKKRKDRKLAKKDPTWRTKLKKDPGIPNLFPYKERILQEIEEKRRLKEEEIARKKAEAKAETKGAKSQDDDAMVDDDVPLAFGSDNELEDEDMQDSVNPMAALLASAKARAAEYDNVRNEDDREDMQEDGEEEWDGFEDDEGGRRGASSRSENPDTSRKAYDKIFKQVVDSADVILYVLDARDPEGTRSREVEREVLSAGGGTKRLILILNKIDLVPAAVLKGWLAHLRRSFPTLPLRAAPPAPNARTFDHAPLTAKSTAETLFNALKAFSRTAALHRAVTAAVLGYPNVGKSSAINALRARLGARTAACPTGAEAGVTTGLRRVKLDAKLALLDAPGIVFGGDKPAHLALLSAVPLRAVPDPQAAVAALLARPGGLRAVLDAYGVAAVAGGAAGDVATPLLVEVARKRGRLGRGGVPNLQAAAMAVLADWRDGRIQGWVEPPPPLVARVEGAGEAQVEGGGDRKIVVKEWAAEFKLEGLWGDGDGDAVDATVEGADMAVGEMQ